MLKLGATPDYMAAVRELASPIRKKYGVKRVGRYCSDVGELSQAIHSWWFQDRIPMADARAKIAADPD